MARDFIQLDEFRRRAKAGEFVSGKDAGVGVQVAAVVSAAVDPEKRTARFVITDATIDRSKDILFPQGGQFNAYKRNPVFLWAHDYGLLPIGKCVEGPVVEADGVAATFQYHDNTKSPLAEMVWQQVLDGTLRAVSIGFVPMKWAFNEDRGFGIDFEEWELIEVSQVPVPCNPNALLDDGKGVAQLEAFVKDLRAQTDARRKTKEPTVADKKTITVTVELDADKAEKAIEELERKARNLGGTIKDAATAQDDENADDAHAQMAGHIKAMGEHCAALDGLKKDYGAAVGEAQAHAKAMGALVDAMGSVISQDGDGKGLADALAKALTDAKGAGAHAISASQMKRVKSIAKAASEIQAAHHAAQGAADGEPDEEEGEQAEPEKAAPTDPTQAWLDTEAKRLGVPVNDVIATLAQREIARMQGRLD